MNSLDHYKAFYYVAKHKSFTMAAKHLYTGQPNVTRSIKILESHLGCKLFNRSNRVVTLTADGEHLYDRVSKAMLLIESAEKELALEKELKYGSVTIGATDFAVATYLLPVLRDFEEENENININISIYSTPEALTALGNGTIDLAILTIISDKPILKYGTVLKRLTAVAVGGPKYNFLKGKKLELSELLKYPMIGVSEKHQTFEFYSQYFSDHGLEYKPDIKVSSSDQILPMIRNNLGIGFVPKELLTSEYDKENLTVIKLEKKFPKWYVLLVNRKNASFNSAQKAFEKALIDNKQV